MTKISNSMRMVSEEFEKATGRHKPLNSAHEGWAVLREEVDELWEEVKKGGTKSRSVDRMTQEAVQVAAMALRFLHDICRVDDIKYQESSR